MTVGEFLLSKSSLSSGTALDLLKSMEVGSSSGFVFGALECNIDVLVLEADLKDATLECDMEIHIFDVDCINEVLEVNFNKEEIDAEI